MKLKENGHTLLHSLNRAPQSLPQLPATYLAPRLRIDLPHFTHGEGYTRQQSRAERIE